MRFTVTVIEKIIDIFAPVLSFPASRAESSQNNEPQIFDPSDFKRLIAGIFHLSKQSQDQSVDISFPSPHEAVLRCRSHGDIEMLERYEMMEAMIKKLEEIVSNIMESALPPHRDYNLLSIFVQLNAADDGYIERVTITEEDERDLTPFRDDLINIGSRVCAEMRLWEGPRRYRSSYTIRG